MTPIMRQMMRGPHYSVCLDLHWGCESRMRGSCSQTSNTGRYRGCLLWERLCRFVRVATFLTMEITQGGRLHSFVKVMSTRPRDHTKLLLHKNRTLGTARRHPPPREEIRSESVLLTVRLISIGRKDTITVCEKPHHVQHTHPCRRRARSRQSS